MAAATAGGLAQEPIELDGTTDSVPAPGTPAPAPATPPRSLAPTRYELARGGD